MKLIQLGLGNVNPTVGAFEANTNRILKLARRAAEQNCQVFATGENGISGYPCEDRIQWDDFVAKQGKQLMRLCDELNKFSTSNMVTIVGLTVKLDGHLYNVAAVIADGTLVGLVPKENLPDYSVFYEGRTVTPGEIGMNAEWSTGRQTTVPIGDLIFEFHFGKMAVEVCEDIWCADGPMVRRTYAGANLVVNISASPYRIGVRDTRKEMINTRASDNNAVVAYVNLVGAQDSLIFDGGAYVSACGSLVHESLYCVENLETCIVDLDRAARMRRQNTTWRRGSQKDEDKARVTIVSTTTTRSCGMPNNKLPYPSPKHKNFFMPPYELVHYNKRDVFFQELTEVIKLGLHDNFFKTNAFDRIVVALSGGYDSCLTAILAGEMLTEAAGRFGIDAEAYVKDKLWLVNMPSKHNASETKDISRLLAEGLGATYIVSPIQDEVDAELAKLTAMVGDREIDRIAKQNIQARVRGARMWNLANQMRGLWLQTSNMSEKAVGYTTIGGDMMGGLSLIANMPKTVVIECVRWYNNPDYHNNTFVLAVEELLKSKASAELEDNQEDEKDLMPFPILDACMHLFVSEKLTIVEVRDVIREMWTDEELKVLAPNYEIGDITKWVKRFGKLFFRSIFKWVQTPISLHLGSLDLERERALQLPVMQAVDIDAEFVGHDNI